MTLVEQLRGLVSSGSKRPGELMDEAADEITRLNAALQWEQNRSERIGTHGPGCHAWGPAHYECLLRENTRLTAELAERQKDRDELITQLQESEKDAARYRFVLPIITGEDSDAADKITRAVGYQLMRGLDGNAAIDAAMEAKP